MRGANLSFDAETATDMHRQHRRNPTGTMLCKNLRGYIQAACLKSRRSRSNRPEGTGRIRGQSAHPELRSHLLIVSGVCLGGALANYNVWRVSKDDPTPQWRCESLNDAS